MNNATPVVLGAIVTVTAATIGVLGAVLGAWVNQRGARETATQTVEAQRLVARDQALREWRRTQDQPLLDYMHHKVQLAHRIDFAVWTKYRDSFDAIRAEHNAGDLADHAPDIYTFQDELLGAAITKLHRNRSP